MSEIDYHFYGAYYNDLNGMNQEELKSHYENYGKKEGRIISEEHYYNLYPEFNLHFYEHYHTDLSVYSNNKILLMRHYEDYGKNENRECRKIYGVYFICCMNQYLSIVKEQLDSIIKSGLYNITNKIYIFITLYYKNNKELIDLLKSYDNKNKFVCIFSSANLYEKFAINNYKKYVPQEEKYYLYYFHTKGLKHKNDPTLPIFTSRRKLLDYYTLEKYKINIHFLNKGYHAVGCALSLYPKKHFSGNFWWSKSEYLATLTDKINDGYLSPEMYVLSNENCKPISLAQDTNDVLFNHYSFRSNKEIVDNASEDFINNIESKHEIARC
jgi:hypothetical protein